MLKKLSARLFLSPPIFQLEHLGPLQEEGITHVLNLAGNENGELLRSGGFRFQIVRFSTQFEQELYIWQQLYTFFEQALAEPESKIVIHCVGGPYRSASAAYLALRMQDVTEAGALQFLAAALPGETPVYAGQIEAWLAARSQMISPSGGL